MITVVSPGSHSTVQDLGRYGHYAMGLPPSGALDQFSHRCANLLVGNHPSAATVELTMAGPTVQFAEAAVVAVTGGDADIWIADRQVPSWTAHQVSAGEQVQIKFLRSGARAYLAVRGGIDSPPFLGSRATYTTSRIGGVTGLPLRAGDTLPVGELFGGPARLGATIGDHLRPPFQPQTTVRVLEGLCNYRFTPESRHDFFTETFTVTPVSDRTGYRLDGPALSFVDRVQPFGAGDNPSNVVDLGYPVGSIQAPNGKQAICLLRDAVTGGGYATFGTIVSCDIDLLAQTKAPDEILFERIDLAGALIARRDHRRRLERVAVELNLLTMF